MTCSAKLICRLLVGKHADMHELIVGQIDLVADHQRRTGIHDVEFFQIEALDPSDNTSSVQVVFTPRIIQIQNTPAMVSPSSNTG